MFTKSVQELNEIRDECYSMVTRRATAAGGLSAIPIPGVDIASDILILVDMIAEINNRFGLSKEQLENYSSTEKQIIYRCIKNAGVALIGVEVTKTAVAAVAKQVAKRAIFKQALKFVPGLGWAINAAIGFGAMKYVGNSHVDDCYRIAKELIGRVQ